ncbi:glycosyltransferase family 4 protein [Pseudovibrio sp. POLY-S9]|uniref:glycosyltransferase family 4 protein n=1 Tax=Pseudovibrio sp. POLY-S9 TaxID=1576596 RepID=UPI000710F0CB|nr:glycosyltransferase family 4 protein [Pseudovibrio sp. POLY-S9]
MNIIDRFKRLIDNKRADFIRLRLKNSYLAGGLESLKEEVDCVVSNFAEHEKLLYSTATDFNKSGNHDASALISTVLIGIREIERYYRMHFWASQKNSDFLQASKAGVWLENKYGKKPTTKQQEFLTKLHRSPTYQLSLLKELDVQKLSFDDFASDKIAYFLHNSLPYSSGGYATRGHGLAVALANAGYDVTCVTRPGYPFDVPPKDERLDVPLEDIIDGISYQRLLSPRRDEHSAKDYMLQAADIIEGKLKELRPSLVIGASNHVTALPALIASKRLGVPFIYEVRGFWEITRISREPEFAKKPAFNVQKILETEVAKHAAHVFTLTRGMKNELCDRGVESNTISILPNSCDVTKFNPSEKDHLLAAELGYPSNIPVIGYIGTFVQYEGLEHLVEACSLLKTRGKQFRLLLVGNENASGNDRGPITKAIEDIAAKNDMGDWVSMPGRIPHEDVPRYYSLIDIAPFPRKPQPVTELVSPMKPLEALSMKKAIVVSSVAALSEMVRDGETGLIFEKGNIENLADKLEVLIDDAKLRDQLGDAGRKWVFENRTWNKVAQDAARKLNEFC